MGNKGYAYGGFVWIPERKRPLVTPMHGIEDNIKMDIRKRRWVGVNWTVMAEDSDK
jgi:hypothetical protein